MARTRLDPDVTIIGGGGAGVAVALEAGEAGARVVLLEQDDALGGTGGRVAGGWAAHEAGFGPGFAGKPNR